MSERKERLQRKLAAGHPAKKRFCADRICGWWGVSSVNLRCPSCGERTVCDAIR